MRVRLQSNSKKSIAIRNMDQISLGNVITQLFIWIFGKISVFQAVSAGYAKLYHSDRLLYVVNNTPAIGIW